MRYEGLALLAAVSCAACSESGETSAAGTSGAATDAAASGAGASSTSTGVGAGGSGGTGAAGSGGAGTSSTAAGGAGGAGPIPCGSAFCRADQTCTDGACVFPCTGVTVPGDYATVASAVGALSEQGGTICILPGSYPEQVEVPFRAPLEIIGTSFEDVHLTSLVAPGGSPIATNNVPNAKLTLKGIDLQQLSVHRHLLPTDSSVDVIAVRVVPTQASAWSVFLNCPANIPVSFDGCDLSNPHHSVLQICTLAGDASSLTIQNSWIHGAPDNGVYLYSADAQPASLHVTLTNNTFTGNDTALFASKNFVDVTYANNVFADNGVAVSVVEVSNGHHNAFEMNTTKFAGAAVPGDGDVDAGCTLDTAKNPPSLASGSACIDAADPATSTTVDYWAVPRGSQPDVGATEVP
jgi:hypothetical protein